MTDIFTLAALWLVFGGVSLVSFAILPWLTPRFFRRFGDRPSERKPQRP